MDMQSELKDLHEQTGKTFVLVTHDQEEAMAMSDTIVVMNGGRIEQVGTPVELYHRPRSRFVAGFIGHNNILQCRVVGTGAEMVLPEWHGHRFQAAADGPAPTPGETVFVALRPETIACAPAPGGLVGQVRRKVFRGTSTTLAIAIPDGSAHGAPLTATLDPGRAAALGETVQVSFPPGAARVLAD
jgi:spermidine/putrescine transport system ATP-binding protein